jgi:hypothetical protein
VRFTSVQRVWVSSCILWVPGPGISEPPVHWCRKSVCLDWKLQTMCRWEEAHPTSHCTTIWNGEEIRFLVFILDYWNNSSFHPI